MRYSTLIFLILFSLFAAAQKKPSGIIAGNVLDSANNKPVVAATITIIPGGDLLRTRSMITAADGYFEANDLEYAWYRVKITAMGFAPLVIDSIHLRAERFDFHLGDIKLQRSANELEQVVVFAEKPMLESSDGKITFNAGESALSAGSTTADMLRNLPLVSNDANGKLLLRGKEPRIMIDEKPVDLNPQQLTELLESMPGGAIEKIELIQNPSPEMGTEPGGVINIVTKKGKVGFTGRMSISAGTRGEASIGANLGYRTSKWNLQSNINLGGSQLTGYNTSRRTNYYTDSTNNFNTGGNFENISLRPNVRIQADYTVNKQHSLSAVLQANSNHFDNESFTRFENINRYDVLWKLSERRINSAGNSYNLNPQLTWQWKNAKHAGENLRFISSISAGNYYNDRGFEQEFLDPVLEQPISPDSLQAQVTDNHYFNTQHRLNYNRPLVAKKLTLNLGAGYLTTRNDNALQSSYLDKTGGEWVTSSLLSNEFVFDQQIQLWRAGFTWQMKKGWRMIPYVQWEQTKFTISNKGRDGASNTYDNWLPGITMRKDIDKRNNFNFVYRMSVRRPGVNELNPAVDYGDPYNLRLGNPLLDPSVGHHIDLNYGYTKDKSYFNASLGYNKLNDIIAQVRTLVQDGKTVLTYRNIASRSEYEASVWTGYSFSRMFRLNASGGYTYATYPEAQREQYGYRNGHTYYASININFIFSGRFSMDASTRFNNTADPQGQSRSNLNSSFGVQYKMFDRRLILSFAAIDPFTPQEFTSTTNGKNFYLESLRSNKTRNFRLTIGWQLNKVLTVSQLKKAPTKKAAA